MNNNIFRLDKHEIGGNEVFIIAEACDNHLGNINIAIEMIKQAKQAGADCIKFQHHLPDEEMLPNTPMSSNFDEPLYDFLKKYALTLDQHIILKKVCEEEGILYLCTPFSYKAAEELNNIGVKFFKIGSGEMSDIPTLKKISKFNKPIFISTGMSTFDEIVRTYDSLKDEKINLVFMNCLSEYPPIYEDMNLKVINRMQSLLPKAVIGHSDHTPDLYTAYAAVTLGAKIIEKHIILDKNQPGPDQFVSIDMNDLKLLVDGIRKISKSLGSEKKINEKEKEIRTWALRSLVVLRDIKEGDILLENMIWSKRPGTGIPAWQMNEVIGKKAKKFIKKNSLIKWEDLE